MEINRNQYFMIGLVILLLGLQFRWVETYVLNERASRFVAEKLEPAVGNENGSQQFMSAMGATPRRTLHPPVWLGYALMSSGGVLILHSLAMRKPGG